MKENYINSLHTIMNMNKLMVTILLHCLIIILSGIVCSEDSRIAVIVNSDQIDISKNQKLIDDSVSESPSFVNLRRKSSVAAYLIDNVQKDGFILAIGENLSDHFTRWSTLKIYRNGIVAKLITDQNGNESWKIEYAPFQ